MDRLSRRSVLRASAGVAAGALMRPFVANAAATTVSVWWAQGFVPDEDTAFLKMVADFEKASGSKVAPTIVPFAPLRQKIISAITSGVVPDLIYATPAEVTPEQAWADKLVDVSDVIETQKARFHPAVLQTANCYNPNTKRRSYYGVPFEAAVVPFHVWSSLVKKAGYQMSDIPNRWDGFIDFFKPVQKKLQALGMRHTYATGFVVSTVGVDPLNTFHQFMIAYGGKDIVTPDGKLHSDDPKVRNAVVEALVKLSSLFKEGYIPKGSVNWNDADDNNAFHSQLAVMDFDGTLSTEVAMLKNAREAYYHDVKTLGLPLHNDGSKMPSQLGTNLAIIPKGAASVAGAKEFAKFMIQPEVSSAFLKGGLGRWLPVFPELVKNDPWWTDPKIDPHRPPYVKQGMDEPTIPFFFVHNPAWAQVRTEHLFQVAWAEIVNGGAKPEEAAAKAFRRAEAIFAKYPIAQS